MCFNIKLVHSGFYLFYFVLFLYVIMLFSKDIGIKHGQLLLDLGQVFWFS